MSKTATRPMSVTEVCNELISLQRMRTSLLKAQIKQNNSTLAFVAVSLGYNAGAEETERDEVYKASDDYVKSVRDGTADECVLSRILREMLLPAGDGFGKAQEEQQKMMVKMAKNLPVAAWVARPQQNGFGLGGLATVVGEAGDLSRFATVAKLWKWMGCSPFDKGGVRLMGSTWRGKKQGSLTAEEWEQYGYNPYHRSVMFNVGECLIKSNKVNGSPGPYYRRYLDVKKSTAEKHPEWMRCGVCEATGKTPRGGACKNCKGTGSVSMHVHRHASLLMVKSLLRNLWCAWNDAPVNDTYDLWHSANS